MDRPVPEHDPERLIAELVRTDRLHLLFRQSVFAVLGSYLGACILCWLCWDRFDHRVIALWIGLLTLVTLLRAMMFVAYFRSPVAERTPQRWERSYWISLVLNAGVWGGGAFAVLPPGDLLAQAVVLLFCVGMCVSAVSCYSAYRYISLVAMGLVLLPCTLWLLFQPLTMQMGMAMTALVFSCFVAGAIRTLSNALEKAFRLSHEMERAHRIASYAAQTDELTGLKNRRAFFEQAQQLYSYCKRQQRPLCAFMLDLDHFKQINDTYGHQVGDEVLRQVGAVIRSSFRDSDVHGRLGGEEFAVLLADTSLEGALSIAEQLGQAIARLQFLLENDSPRGMTVSLGIAITGSADRDLHHLLNKADKAMYRAKALGRNQVVVADGA